MNARDAILTTYTMGDGIVSAYLGDLSDADLLVRPVPGMNHIAYQLGHLISGERWMVEAVQPGSCPPLPEGFDAQYQKEGSGVDDPAKFLSKETYLALWRKQRAATKQVLETLTPERMDAPGPDSFKSYAPTIGAIMTLVGTHVMMHVGQWVAVRRALGKPVTI